MAEFLRLDHVSAGYGESVVLEQVSFALQAGDSLAVLGRNGVGKTTLLTTLMGLTRLHGGAIHWCDLNISRLPAHQRARAGIGWVPQERHMFPSLSVEEHLTAVARAGPWNAERVFNLFPPLAERSRNLGYQLSGGEQQMLAIARALVVNPRLLSLDEPLEGLAPKIVQGLLETLRNLIADGRMAIIIVEQRAKLALSLTQHTIVLDRGRIVHRSDSGSLLRDPDALNRLVAVS